ncbi:MerR family transcriptional regulator [Rhodococcus sp. ARC_M12]|uniref:MerR family transcriptional regulator n=1 Tax=unclassified Rhodococcus (in: high G+C Gram-positive bacteria) TaxID=192944 RepID=UPI001FB532C5|nr:MULTISPECIES: MerR family transcriptional regulator [unclassified Rhodococcus (in: high G+C Gram-positive bacteria)]MCJ0893111.1 MerR family transcriptional regulator [Rhodococcus sp. ARC_M5]MCJ0977320.1 MerR family transcriptional regulator [Rhodococcus sp. ARC_M12]
MTWSTSELAELATTTVNTVRHYHRCGLLDEPYRRSNGYKQYGVTHLVRLLQIRRLRDIGVPLAEIQATGSGVGTSADVLTAIDANLADVIASSLRTRAQIALLLEHGSITEVPAGLERTALGMTPAERSMALVYSQVYDTEAMDDVRDIIESDDDAATIAFEALPADADEDTRTRLADEFADTIAKALVEYPWMSEPNSRLMGSPSLAGEAIAETIREFYNTAQLDVLLRATVIARQRHR